MVRAKPCPVCGGDEFSIDFAEIGNGEVEAFIMCDSCDEDDDTQGPVAKAFDEEGAEEAAILAWNNFVESYSTEKAR